jgi:hypothetical protein
MLGPWGRKRSANPHPSGNRRASSASCAISWSRRATSTTGRPGAPDATASIRKERNSRSGARSSRPAPTRAHGHRHEAEALLAQLGALGRRQLPRCARERLGALAAVGIPSAYVVEDDARFWDMTEADRCAATVLLSEEYRSGDNIGTGPLGPRACVFPARVLAGRWPPLTHDCDRGRRPHDHMADYQKTITPSDPAAVRQKVTNWAALADVSLLDSVFQDNNIKLQGKKVYRSKIRFRPGVLVLWVISGWIIAFLVALIDNLVAPNQPPTGAASFLGGTALVLCPLGYFVYYVVNRRSRTVVFEIYSLTSTTPPALRISATDDFDDVKADINSLVTTVM